MGIENKQRSTDDTFAPIRTLDQFDSAVLVGTLVWGKLGDWPWWPGLVVASSDIGWPVLKKKDIYCILWLGPHKTASVMPAHKLSDFLDQNLVRLMNQPFNGDEKEDATSEALRGAMSRQMLDQAELDMIPPQILKSLAVQIRTQTDIINGRKQVVVKKTSFWFKRTIGSVKSANRSLDNVASQKKRTRLPSATNMQKRVSTASPFTSNDERSPSSSSSSTRSSEVHFPKFNRRERSTKKLEEEDESPPRKKVALVKQPGQGALNKYKADGMSLMLHKFLQDDECCFRSLKPSKLVEEEKAKATSVEQSPSPVVLLEVAIPGYSSTEERLKAIDLRQKKLAKRLIKIDSELFSNVFK